MKTFLFILHFLPLGLFTACNNADDKDDNGTGNKGAFLSLKVDGVEWKAERDIFGSFNLGTPGLIIISGQRGPTDGNEQDFTANLYNTTGVGTYTINKESVMSVAQIALPTPGVYPIYKTQFGGTMTFVITKAEGTDIEGTFSGTLEGADKTLTITEGKFDTE